MLMAPAARCPPKLSPISFFPHTAQKVQFALINLLRPFLLSLKLPLLYNARQNASIYLASRFAVGPHVPQNCNRGRLLSLTLYALSRAENVRVGEVADSRQRED